MTNNTAEDITVLHLSDEDGFILDGALSDEYKIYIAAFNEKYCFYGSIIPLDIKKRITYIGIKVRSIHKTQLVIGYKCKIDDVDLRFLECVCDENNRILEILFVKDEWYDGTQTTYNTAEHELVVKSEEIFMIDGYKGLYVEMEDSYNECLLQFVQSVNRTKYGHCYHDDELEKDNMNETIDTNIDVNIDDSIEQSQLPNNISTSSNKRVAKN